MYIHVDDQVHVIDYNDNEYHVPLPGRLIYLHARFLAHTYLKGPPTEEQVLLMMDLAKECLAFTTVEIYYGFKATPGVSFAPWLLEIAGRTRVPFTVLG